MIKKITSLILALCLIIGCTASMTACSSEKADGGKMQTEQSSENAKSSKKSDSKTASKSNKTDKEEKKQKEADKASDVQDKSHTSDKHNKTHNKTNNKTNKSDNAQEKPAEEFVTVSIDGCFSGKSIVIKSGDNVYAVLKRCGVSVSAEDSIYGVYVKGINGLKEGDKGAGSGWTYKVNGVMPNESAGKHKVKAGDHISWEYVKGGF